LKHVFVTFVAGGFCGKGVATTTFVEAVGNVFDSTTWRLLPQGRWLCPLSNSISPVGHWNKAGMVINIIQSGYMPVWNNMALPGWIFMKFCAGLLLKSVKEINFVSVR